MAVLAGKRTLSDINFGKRMSVPRRITHEEIYEARSKEVVVIFIERQYVVEGEPRYEIFTGNRMSTGGINPRFDTLPRARAVAKVLRDTYKAMGHTVQCNLRPR